MTLEERRHGMTLVEMLIGLVVGGIMLGALVGLFINQSQLTGDQASRRAARDVVRSASRILSSDIRRLESLGGVEHASPDSVTLRVPFAAGLVCASSGGGSPSTTLSLLPTDSVRYATAEVSGLAWRSQAGDYSYVPTTGVAAGAASTCSSASISTLSGGRVVDLSAGSGAIPEGAPAFVYERIRYAFTDTGSGLSLVRTLVESGDEEVLVTNFGDAGTRFRFFVGASTSAQDAPPSDLGDLTGLELVLEGRGDRPRVSDGTVATESSTVPVFFKNQTN